MKIYRHLFVQNTLDLHNEILNHPAHYSTVKEQLILIADNLYFNLKKRNPIALKVIETFHPEYHDRISSEIPNAGLGREDCQLVIAKEYGYQNWEAALSESDLPFDKNLEQAIDFLVSGKKEELNKLIKENPDVLDQHSPYWHSAGLIHYIASNGVEIWRQSVPENLVEITDMLLQLGANPNMPNNIYGGSNLINLIETSSHPHQVGIAQDLIKMVKSSQHYR